MKKFLWILLISNLVCGAISADKPLNTKTMKKFELQGLPYAHDALAPVISQKTIEFHYGKHLLAYITNLNNLLESSDLKEASLETIIQKSSGGLFNNAAQVWNHEFYFATFAPADMAAHLPTGRLLDAINKTWGHLDTFKKEFVAAGVSQFGSGWVWLVKDSHGNLSIQKTANAENPLTDGLTPLLTFDVWEHSYYIDYQNRRADHLHELWEIVDWRIVESRY